MKYFIPLFIFLLPLKLSAQTNEFADVDSFASTVDYHAPDTLARLLTEPYNTELKKVRSIFYWITTHISYDVEKFHNRSDEPLVVYFSPWDSATKCKAHIQHILNKKMGVCSDYAKLFKTLCSYANIKAEEVDGYSHWPTDSIGATFKDNHAWNAVMINNKWYLLDATWASGSCDDNVTLFTPHFNGYYFLTPPEMMIWNHFPADRQWFLTTDTISLNDFFNLPNIYIAEYENKIKKFSPVNGIIKAKVGSKIKFEFEIPDTAKEIDIQPDPEIAVKTKPYILKPKPKQAANKSKHVAITSNSDIDQILNYADKQKGKKQEYIYPETKHRNYTIANNTVTYYYKLVSAKTRSLKVYYDDNLMLEYNIKIIK